MRQGNSIWMYVLAIVGFFAIFSILASIFGAILFLIIKILIPIAIIAWLVQVIGRNLNGHRRM